MTGREPNPDAPDATRPRGRRIAAALAALTLLAGCTLGPSERPPLATFGTGATGTRRRPHRRRRRWARAGPGQLADPIQWESLR